MSASLSCSGSNGKCTTKVTLEGEDPSFPEGWSLTSITHERKFFVLCPVCTRVTGDLLMRHESEKQREKELKDSHRREWREKLRAIQHELSKLEVELFE